MNRKVVLTGILMATMLMAGCGSKTANYMAVASSNAKFADSYYAAESAMTSDSYETTQEVFLNNASGSSTGSTTDLSDKSVSNQKLIKTVSMDVETKEFNELMTAIEEKAAELGGYIDRMESYNGSRYSGTVNTRSASLTVRIPQSKLSLFVGNVSELSNITRKSESVTNVTLNYIDVQSKKESLQVEQERLLELLSRAEYLDDIITLEERLSNIRYQIENMERQLRSFDDQVEYSTVNLTVQEVKELTPVVVIEETTWERIAKGFTSSMTSIGISFREFFVWFVVKLPYLVIWGIVIGVIVLVTKKSIKKKKAKEEAKKKQYEEQRAAYAAQMNGMNVANNNPANRQTVETAGTEEKK